MRSDGRLEQLAESLAFDPTDWTSFEGVVALLTRRESWTQLERAYRKMIHAVVAAPVPTLAGRDKNEAQRELWWRLAAVYRDRLGDPHRALMALELLAQLAPPERFLLEALARLYEQTDQRDRALEIWEAYACAGDHPNQALRPAKKVQALLDLAPGATVGRLEQALALRLDEPLADHSAHGSLSAESADLRVTARYGWDMYHESPVRALDDLRGRAVYELSVSCGAGRADVLAELERRHGPGRSAGEWLVFGGGWLLKSEGADGLTLSRHAELPDWAAPAPDVAARAQWLRSIAACFANATSNDAVVVPDVPPGSGIVRHARTQGLEVQLVPAMPALELAAILGWDAPVAEATDVHLRSWRIRIIERGIQVTTRTPRLGSWLVSARLVERPRGARIQGYDGPPGGCYQLAPTDCVRSLCVEGVHPDRTA